MTTVYIKVYLGGCNGKFFIIFFLFHCIYYPKYLYFRLAYFLKVYGYNQSMR